MLFIQRKYIMYMKYTVYGDERMASFPRHNLSYYCNRIFAAKLNSWYFIGRSGKFI